MYVLVHETAASGASGSDFNATTCLHQATLLCANPHGLLTVPYAARLGLAVLCLPRHVSLTL